MIIMIVRKPESMFKSNVVPARRNGELMISPRQYKTVKAFRELQKKLTKII